MLLMLKGSAVGAMWLDRELVQIVLRERCVYLKDPQKRGISISPLSSPCRWTRWTATPAGKWRSSWSGVTIRRPSWKGWLMQYSSLNAYVMIYDHNMGILMVYLSHPCIAHIHITVPSFYEHTFMLCLNKACLCLELPLYCVFDEYSPWYFNPLNLVKPYN